MRMKELVNRHYREKVNLTSQLLRNIPRVNEGWIRTVRKALGMSGADLAKRLGVSRARVSSLELDEVNGKVSISSLEKAAEAMGCRFVYAVISENDIETLIEKRAQEKARKLVETVSTNMALEKQELPKEKREERIKSMVAEMLKSPTLDLWKD